MILGSTKLKTIKAAVWFPSKPNAADQKGEPLMVSAILVRSENELHEFYEWLLCRAQEEEANGNNNHAYIYREYADIIKYDSRHLNVA
jgi:hypothetical protein